MSLNQHKTMFVLLCFYPLSLSVQTKGDLLTSDHDALMRIYKEFTIHPSPEKIHCGSTGVSCERRLVNESLVLRVTRLVLERQQMKGKLSPAIGELSELIELSLPGNQLVGEIPVGIIGCKKLQVLNLRNNGLSGKIPQEFSSLTDLRVLDLSSNMLEGGLMVLGSLHNLERLNLADNFFAGEVPESFRSFRNLGFMDISGNSLVQDVFPLSGARYVFSEISQGTNASSAAVASNSNQSRRKRVLQWIERFSIGILLGSVTGFIPCLLFKLFVLSAVERKTGKSMKIFSTKIKSPEDLAFLEREDALESLQIIGRGGCGEVYKASLPGSNRIEIAIKKIALFPKDAEGFAEEKSKSVNKKLRQIRSEIQTMGMIRHPNLLPVLAYVSQPSCHYLVFEYMKNGSLQDYLQQSQKEFPWLERYRIALGMARGLEHLHKHSPRIIHRDLKPGNVLLDDEMEAKITDFGLAKALPDANTHASTSNVAGTLGYIAPEYYQTSQFTEKCDIYSFGVMLAVLVTGKFPSDEFFLHTDDITLMRWVRNAITSEEPRRVIDPKLLGNGYEEQMLLVLKVACFCTLNDPKERPNSTDVRCMLFQLKHEECVHNQSII